MRLAIVILPPAAADIASATHWLEEVRPGLAATLRAEIDRIVEQAAQFPDSYAAYRGSCRRAVLTSLDYALLYRRRAGSIEIVGLMHCRVDPQRASGRVKKITGS